MNCKEFSNLLDAYLDGAFSREEADRLDEHAASCGDCASLLALRKDCRRLDEEIEAPDAFSSSWRRMIQEEAKMEKNTSHAPVRRKWTAYLAAAAALVFIIGGTALTRDRLPSASRVAGQENGAAYDRTAVSGDRIYGKLAMGSASNTTYDDYDMEYPSEDAAEYEYAMDAVMMPAAAPMMDEGAGEARSAREEKIIRTASFSIKTTAYDDDLERLQAMAGELGGRVEYLSTGGDVSSGQTRYAYLTLRIPTGRLDEFLEGAQGIGSVTDMTQERQDVSDSYYDTQARLDTQKEKLTRLQALMQSAKNVSDLVEIESAVADAQYWIDRYTSQLKSYDGRVEYSTVSASVREVKVTEMEDVSLGQRIGEGVRSSLRGGAEFLQDAVVFLAAALPWLAAAGLLIGLVCWAVRTGKKNSKKEKQ